MYNMIQNKKLSDINVNELPEYLKKEVKKIPLELQQKIIVNKNIQTLPPSNFANCVKSSEIQKLEKLLMNNCIKDESLYDLSKPVVIDGFNVRLIKKGTNIYKEFQGFVTKEQILSYSEKNPNKPSWFGNKFLVYAIARNDWGSIVSLVASKDLYLIDYFDNNNLEKLITLLSSYPNMPNIDIKQIINMLIYSTGYNISLSEQLEYIIKNYNWKAINIYTDDYNKGFEYYYCKTKRVEGLNPIASLTSIHNTEIMLFNVLLSKFPDIDGFIKPMINSTIDYGGKYYHEEILIKNSSIFNKTQFDTKDPLCWVNWKIKDLDNYAGLNLSYTITKFTSKNSIANENFVLIKYYNNNHLKYIPLKKKYILSFNVNKFINLNSAISYDMNLNNILDLIEHYKDNIEIITFQDVKFNNNNAYENFNSKLVKMFPFIYYYDNGIKNTQLMVALKKKYGQTVVNLKLSNNEEIKNFSNNKDTPGYYPGSLARTIRNIVILKTEEHKIALIHLESGLFNVKDEKENNKVINVNSKLRCLSLKKILDTEPDLDIIIGDFNFVLNSDESRFLMDRGFEPEINKTDLSTPYNRTDHCFIRKSKKTLSMPLDNILLKCNYSLHLPMFQEYI
jgi:hypothetical protein